MLALKAAALAVSTVVLRANCRPPGRLKAASTFATWESSVRRPGAHGGAALLRAWAKAVALPRKDSRFRSDSSSVHGPPPCGPNANQVSFMACVVEDTFWGTGAAQSVLRAVDVGLPPLLVLLVLVVTLFGVGTMRESRFIKVNVELVELVGEGKAAVGHDAMATGHVELRPRLMFWETYGIQLYGTSEQLSCCTADSHLCIHPTSAGRTVALKHGSITACSSGSGWPGKRWKARVSTSAAWDSSAEQCAAGLP